jgi:hypothetical protein
MRRAILIPAFLLTILLTPQIGLATAWSNGGYSADINNPDYGTHDWIAQHALDWLPAEKKQYITDNLATYLYGTELPDLPSMQGGIGDTTKHHIYYSADGTLEDDASAVRAEAEYQLALSFLETGNDAEAAKHAGAMTHYIADMAVFGHVMGASTDWGTETHHSDYENHVTSITTSYSASYTKPLQFNGVLTTLPVGDAARQLALDTTLDNGGTHTASWMDTNYDWTNTAFTDRSWESVNLATNKIADALSTLYDAHTPPKTQTIITLTTSKTTAKENEQITVSGTINADVTATVTIQKNEGSSWTTITNTSSTHGAYSTQITPPEGSHTIRATWTGDATHEPATSTTTTLTITPRTGTLKITAIDDQNTPIPGATITTTKTPTGQTPLQDTTTTDGTATFSDIRTGDYTINAAKTDHNTNTSEAQITDQQTTTIQITLTRTPDKIPGYPIEAVMIGIALFLGYLNKNDC